jgi:uncharacterized iron-regulated protein
MDRRRTGRNRIFTATHWYANWRFDYGLYRDILDYAKEKRLRVIALNLPFQIPPKIRVGGIASLSEADRRHLPARSSTPPMPTTGPIWKKYFDLHAFRGRDTFDFFYEAQCTWEDTMAEAVAGNLGTGNDGGAGRETDTSSEKFGDPQPGLCADRRPLQNDLPGPGGR